MDAGLLRTFERHVADRLAFLVDAEAYFASVADSIERAERTIFILGWDVDARTPLPDPRHPGRTITLRRLLRRTAASRPKLQVRILGWDFSTLFVLERQMFPKLHLDWRTHPRVTFHADNTHPFGAAHHQKIVVIDDHVAYCGGLDLTIRRWDTRDHPPSSPRRVDPEGAPYRPFHDIQLLIEGEAAAALARLARERWRRATGEEVGPMGGPEQAHAWPARVRPDAERAQIVLTRTRGQNGDEPPVVEVRESLLEQIRSATRLIYVENQYLSCQEIGDALLAKLEEPHGPEIVLVLPRKSMGWLEYRSMTIPRKKIIARLRASPNADRLRAVWPISGDAEVYVHAKVLIVDDALARVGSANLSRRSMTLDTECDLIVAADGDPATARAIARFRDGLLAEHLGVTVAEIEGRRDVGWTVGETIDRLGRPERRLVPVEDEAPSEEEDSWLAAIADPEAPLDAEHLLIMMGATPRRARLLSTVGALLLLTALLAVGAAVFMGALR